MISDTQKKDIRIKKKPWKLRDALLTFFVLLLLSGLHSGLVILPAFLYLPGYCRVIIVLLYWALVAASFVAITNWQVKKSYDSPMRKLSAATKAVASGDFSIYVEPIHTPDKYDYIDAMFLDFNTMVEELGSIETMKTDFIANVSHELKTPLAVISNYATMLKKENLPSEVREEYLDTIIEGSRSLLIWFLTY